MRRKDMLRFEKPYPTDESGRPQCDLGGALDCRIEEWRTLLNELRGDLDVNRLGFGWWRLGAETREEVRRRIVLSDYAICAAEGVEHALVDMAIHRLELDGALEKVASFLRQGVTSDWLGRSIPQMPPVKTPLHELPFALVEVHLSGWLRAAASGLDCLAGVIAIVAAVRVPVLRTDWVQLRRRLLSVGPTTELAVDKIRSGLVTALNAAIDAGPPGWDGWLAQYRNLRAHRGSRMKLTGMAFEQTLVDRRGTPIRRASAVPTLLADPDLSDVEALALSGQSPPILEEGAQATLSGLAAELRALIRVAGEWGLLLWRSRRAAPEAMPQPLLDQWREVRRSRTSRFAGYERGTFPFKPGAFTVPPEFARRLHAAALIDPKSELWLVPDDAEEGA